MEPSSLVHAPPSTKRRSDPHNSGMNDPDNCPDRSPTIYYPPHLQMHNCKAAASTARRSIHTMTKTTTITSSNHNHNDVAAPSDRFKMGLQGDPRTDVIVCGDDGIQISAVRCALGSASPVLKRLLYKSDDNDGNSKNNNTTNSTPVVRIPFTTHRTLSTLIDYCNSLGDLSKMLLFGRRQDLNNNDNSGQAQLFRSSLQEDPTETVLNMLAFMKVTIHYQLGGKVPLVIVEAYLIPFMKEYPSLACVVLNYLLAVDNSIIHMNNNDKGSSSSVFSNSKVFGEEQQLQDQIIVISAAALSKLHSSSLSIIRTQPYTALKACKKGKKKKECSNNHENIKNNDDHVGGICSLQAPTLEAIFKDRQIECDELFLLERLVEWYEYQEKHGNAELFVALTKSISSTNSNRMATTRQHPLTHVQREKNGSDEGAQLFFEAHFDDINFDEMTATTLGLTALSSSSSSTSTDTRMEKSSFSQNKHHFLQSSFSKQSGCSSVHDEHHDDTSATTRRSFNTSIIKNYKSTESLTDFCRRLVKSHLDLAAMDPVQLQPMVRRVNFIDQEQLLEALWEQVAMAATHVPKVSFTSIVRGKEGGYYNTSSDTAIGIGITPTHGTATTTKADDSEDMDITEMLADLEGTTLQEKDDSYIDDNRDHDHGFRPMQTRSHIIVQGAGVEDANGIYTQVIVPPRKTTATAMASDTILVKNHVNKEDDDREDYNDDDNDGSARFVTLSIKQTGTVAIPPIRRSNDSSYSAPSIDGPEKTVDENGYEEKEATSVPEQSSYSSTASSSICLRFVKQGCNNNKKGRNKHKTWYLVCRREPMPSMATPDNSANSIYAMPFLHCWNIIEEENTYGGEQLQVLYEWEDEELTVLDGNYSNAGGSTTHKCFVIDSSTLLPFPEHGWSSVVREFSPAPTCQWCRPRHGPSFLAVPPSVQPFVFKQHHRVGNGGDSKSSWIEAHQKRNGSLQFVNTKKESTASTKLGNSTLVDTLADLTIKSATSSEFEENNPPTKGAVDNATRTSSRQSLHCVKNGQNMRGRGIISARHKGSLLTDDDFTSVDNSTIVTPMTPKGLLIEKRSSGGYEI